MKDCDRDYDYDSRNPREAYEDEQLEEYLHKSDIRFCVFMIALMVGIPVLIWSGLKSEKTADKVKNEILGGVIGIEKTAPYDARLHLDTDNDPRTAEVIYVIKTPDEVAKMDVMIGDMVEVKRDGFKVLTRKNPKPDGSGRFNVETTGLYDPAYFDAGIRTGRNWNPGVNSLVFGRASH